MHLKFKNFALFCFYLVFIFPFSAFSAPNVVAPKAIENIKTIGVVSLTGTALQVQYIGPTVFNNYGYLGNVDRWEINDLIKKSVTDRLEQSGRFNVVPVTFDRKPLWDVLWEDLDGVHLIQNTDSGFETLLPHLSKLAAGANADALILIIPGGPGRSLCGFRCGETGYGVYGTSKFGQHAIPGPIAYLSLKVYFLETKTMQPLAMVHIAAKQSSVLPGNSFSAVSDDVLEKIRGLISESVKTELPLALTKMEFLNKPVTTITATKIIPGLTVNVDCCPLNTGVAPDIVNGYKKAAQEMGLVITDTETATVVIDSVIKGNVNWMNPGKSYRNQITAHLNHQGNDFFVEEKNTNLVEAANNIGRQALQKITGTSGN